MRTLNDFRGFENVTIAELQALIAASTIKPYQSFVITNAIAGNILVQADGNSAIFDYAVNQNTGQFGTYVLATDTFTPYVASVTGNVVDNTDPANPIVTAQTQPIKVTGNITAQVDSFYINVGSHVYTDPAMVSDAHGFIVFVRSGSPTIGGTVYSANSLVYRYKHSGSLTNVVYKPLVNADWNAVSGDAEILNKPTLATVATTGSYTDLSNKPKVSITLNSGGSNATFLAGTTYYFSPSYAMATAFTNQQANFTKFVKGGTFKGFTYIWRTTQGNAALVITIQKGTLSTNMADTAATVTVAANSAAGSVNYASDLTINDGDFVTVKAVQGAGGNAGTSAGFFTEFEQQL